MAINELYDEREYCSILREGRETRLPIARQYGLISVEKESELIDRLIELEERLGNHRGSDRWTLRRLLEKDSTDWPRGVKRASYALIDDLVLVHNHVPDRAGRGQSPKGDIYHLFHELQGNMLEHIGHQSLKFYRTATADQVSSIETCVFWLARRFGVVEDYSQVMGLERHSNCTHDWSKEGELVHEQSVPARFDS